MRVCCLGLSISNEFNPRNPLIKSKMKSPPIRDADNTLRSLVLEERSPNSDILPKICAFVTICDIQYDDANPRVGVLSFGCSLVRALRAARKLEHEQL